MKDFGPLLNEMANGDAVAASEVTAAVYAELRLLAASYMRRERRDHSSVRRPWSMKRICGSPGSAR